MKYTSLLLNRIEQLTKASFTETDQSQVRRCLIDYLGVTIAGSQMIGDKADRYVQLLSGGTGSCGAIGREGKYSAETAAFVNGLCSHAAELDDGDRYGMFHPGAPIFSALLTAIQLKKVSSDTFSAAVIAGYEASMLIARSMQPILKEKGFHGTGFAGTVGAAVACAVAFQADRDELTAALSAGCTAASGLLKVIKGKSEMKPLNVAYAALNGLQAALMAKAGFAGSYDVLDGDLGFFRAFCDKPDWSIIERANQNENPLIHSIYVKPYAACRHCHAPIEAALRITSEPGFLVRYIDSVEVSTYSWAIRGHDHTEITGMSSAKMSIPYSVAAALKFKSGDVDVFDGDYLADDEVHQLTKKIRVIEDPEMTRKAPGERGAEVKVKAEAESKVFRYFVALPKGEPENPVSDAELLQKMQSLCRFAGKEESQIRVLADLALNGELSSHQINAVLYPFNV